MDKIILDIEGGNFMKERNSYSREKKAEEVMDLGYEDYIEMFEGGYSDSEISKEFGIDERYIKSLRDEFLNDY